MVCEAGSAEQEQRERVRWGEETGDEKGTKGRRKTVEQKKVMCT